MQAMRRKWQPTPVLLPGESHGQRSLVGYSPQGRKESDMTERLHFTSLHARKCFLASHIYVVSDEIYIQKLHFYFLVIEYDFKVYFT